MHACQTHSKHKACWLWFISKILLTWLPHYFSSVIYFLRTQNLCILSSLNNGVGYWQVSRVTTIQGLSFWNLFPGKKRRILITHRKFKYCCSCTLYNITVHNVVFNPDCTVLSKQNAEIFTLLVLYKPLIFVKGQIFHLWLFLICKKFIQNSAFKNCYTCKPYYNGFTLILLHRTVNLAWYFT